MFRYVFILSRHRVWIRPASRSSGPKPTVGALAPKPLAAQLPRAAKTYVILGTRPLPDDEEVL